MTKTFIVLSCLAVAASGCENAAVEESDEEPTQVEEANITRTVVSVDDNGNENVQVSRITRSEQLAELAAHAELNDPNRARQVDGDGESLGASQAALNNPRGCQASAIWIFDKPNQTGHEICFRGTHAWNLDNFCRDIDNEFPTWCGLDNTWFTHAESFVAGSQAGFFAKENFNHPNDIICAAVNGFACPGFDPFQQVNQTGCASDAKFLALNEACFDPVAATFP